MRENVSTESFSFSMTDSTSAARVSTTNTSAGHLSVHLEGEHPVDVPFLFEQQQKRIGPAVIASFVYHALMFAALMFAIRYSSTATTHAAVLSDKLNPQIIWLSQPGPGGGGGGGGNQMKEPPRKAELPGKDAITVPVQKAPSMQLAKK